ncbi:MAG TPA: thioredoxin domain-containing protein [Methanocella sp.]
MTANKKITALVVLAVFTALLAAGFALVHSASMPAAAQGTVQQYTTADLDNALAKGPVFIEFESKECSYCKQQRPISEALANDYGGKVTFFFVDAAENRALAKQFQVSGVPQMDVLLSKTGNGYTYVDRDGKSSDSLTASRFQGLTDRDTLRSTLDAAVRLRGQ